MSQIHPSIGVITLFEPDLDEARDFYRRLFDKEPDFVSEQTANYHFDNLIINLERDSGANEQIGTAKLAPPESGARDALSMWVENADAACAELAERGVKVLSGPENTAWGTRRAIFMDPGGHIWKIVQKGTG